MRCPFCFHKETKVTDSRITENDSSVRRRRECFSCGSRFTTSEREEPRPLYVVKKNSGRERFDRNKLTAGFLKSCEKLPVNMETIEAAVSKIERKIRAENDREVQSETIGNLVLESLRAIDPVAYIRFAAIYMEFKDIGGFYKILESVSEESNAY